ncbi:alpha-amylase 1-like isoform X3 [Aquarana catesbeiana]|uniref:alpha-amylase 1-like isoform X3 n=1 Tax=Aquarana catesbeiana TaxID=8400 RepID=UPI003CC95307
MRLWLSFVLVGALAEICAAQFNPNVKCGRTSIVHLFEWRWEDIAVECERYLGPNGFGGIQISPPSENVIIKNPNRPWWERYQPVSYKICTRSGNEQQFRDMVTRCNNVGVYIYADAVINHMCGAGVGKGKSSTCVSPYDTITREFPAVPYSSADFNDKKCKSESGGVENYNDANQEADSITNLPEGSCSTCDKVRDCQLVSLLDLALEKEYVRTKIAEYLNHLIDIGVAGFRLDAAKHMWPGDILAVTRKLNNLNTRWFPNGTQPFIYQEVIDLGGEGISASEYSSIGRITEFKYGAKLGKVIRKWDGEKLAYLKNWGEGWGFMPSDRALVFVDNHDNQRGHGAGGASILTFWDARNMVIFRNVVNGQALINWWDNEQNQVAFGRGSAGFIVFNNDNWDMDVTLDTGLPPGTYCDIISGQKEDNRCTGEQISVGNTGLANFKIKSLAEDPFVAIHINAKL